MKRRTFLSAALAALSTPFGLWKMQRRPKLPEPEKVQFIRFTLTEQLEVPLYTDGWGDRPAKALTGDLGKQPECVTVWDTCTVLHGPPGICGLAQWHNGRYEIRWLEEPESIVTSGGQIRWHRYVLADDGKMHHAEVTGSALR